ncbi:MAG: hypothetical protein HC913_14360 [Microscillaceae bacterium]|nr:hypothetical protein [Microscillaceae bacterium]
MKLFRTLLYCIALIGLIYQCYGYTQRVKDRIEKKNLQRPDSSKSDSADYLMPDLRSWGFVCYEIRFLPQNPEDSLPFYRNIRPLFVGNYGQHITIRSQDTLKTILEIKKRLKEYMIVKDWDIPEIKRVKESNIDVILVPHIHQWNTWHRFWTNDKSADYMYSALLEAMEKQKQKNNPNRRK